MDTTRQLAVNSRDYWRSTLSGISTLCVDLWGTVARSDNREPILDAQRILGYKVDSIDPRTCGQWTRRS